MCHHECTENFINLINNLNNDELKNKCMNMGEHVIDVMNEKIDEFSKSLRKYNKNLRYRTNHYLLLKHFLLSSINDVNNKLMSNDTGFVIGVSNELYDYFQRKIFNQTHYMLNTSTPETIYKDMMYINSLIKKHTQDIKLLFRLKKPNTNLHVFYLRIIS